MPTTAVKKATAMSIVSPTIIRLGASTNRKGTIKAGHPNWQAANAVPMGPASASFAAVNAANSWYLPKFLGSYAPALRCARSGWKPKRP